VFKSRTLEGRCLKWAVNLSPWDLETVRVKSDDDGLAAIPGAGINLGSGWTRSQRSSFRPKVIKERHLIKVVDVLQGIAHMLARPAAIASEETDADSPYLR
jgi:hypothetical protein